VETPSHDRLIGRGVPGVPLVCLDNDSIVFSGMAIDCLMHVIQYSTILATVLVVLLGSVQSSPYLC